MDVAGSEYIIFKSVRKKKIFKICKLDELILMHFFFAKIKLLPINQIYFVMPTENGV